MHPLLKKILDPPLGKILQFLTELGTGHYLSPGGGGGVGGFWAKHDEI